ncbi:MAG: hypothetical protein H0V36_09040 [Chloroflexi bacterium]|nr:hypothetical protein [Chloroflexota bacterium]
MARSIKGFASDWGASLLGSVALLPALAAIATVTAAAILGDPLVGAGVVGVDAITRVATVAAGFMTGVLGWAIFALLTRRYARADRANIRMFSELRQRLSGAEEVHQVACHARSSTVEGSAACGEASGHLKSLRSTLGSDEVAAKGGPAWTLGAGYIAAWQQLHRAEEALLEAMPEDAVAALALYDAQRLDGSEIAQRERLLRILRVAVRALSPGLASQLDGNDDDPEITRMEARAVIRQTRRIINEYRDDCAAALVTLRRRLTQSVVFTGLSIYLILGLAIVVGAPISAIVAGSVFYLVGAVVGLLARIRTEARFKTDTEIDDYGVTSARMVHLALLSGMAGVAGVVLVGLLSGASLSEILDPSGMSGTDGGVVRQSLGRIFDLTSYPVGLVVAAIFGLAPERLLARLGDQAESLKLALDSSEASGSSGGGAGEGESEGSDVR